MHSWSRPVSLGFTNPAFSSSGVNAGAFTGQQAAGAASTSARGGGSTQSIVLAAPQIAGAAIGGASAAGASWATAAIPIVGPIIAGVTVGLTLLFSRKGPKQKVATTQIVDAVEPLLRDNLNGYMAGPRTRSSQAQALANFDAGWQYVVEHCDIPEMGNPGKACVSDRSPGGQWDWFAYYRNPIANDPQVKDDVTAALDDVSATLSSGSVAGVPTALLLVGALVAIGIYAGGKN